MSELDSPSVLGKLTAARLGFEGGTRPFKFTTTFGTIFCNVCVLAESRTKTRARMASSNRNRVEAENPVWVIGAILALSLETGEFPSCKIGNYDYSKSYHRKTTELDLILHQHLNLQLEEYDEDS